jgi:small subunit ribosomal protein S17
MANNSSPIHRKFQGIVISTKMDKTIVVRIDRRIRHPKYGKIYTVSKKMKAHDEKNQAQVGDKVEIVENRPLSKTKRWRYLRTISTAN